MDSLKGLRIVYMGTPEFAVEPLKALLVNSAEIVGVVTAPDKPAGRGQRILQSPVKQFAQMQNINTLQPFNLKDVGFIESLKALNADLFIVVAFRMLPKVVWSIPRLGTFNLHASLLPQYRGAAPINWAIMNGESRTGVTTFFIDEKIDTGSVLLQQEEEIYPDDTAGDLHDRLMDVGSELVVRTALKLYNESIGATQQHKLMESGELKPAPKLFKENTRIRWAESSSVLHNFIRGLSPYPAAWTEIVNEEGKSTGVKILRAKVSNSANVMPVGSIKTDGKTYLNVSCGKGSIDVLEIQLSGKKALPIGDFLKGFRAIESYKFI
ncbi:MAG: methionyl-tRNA formyltransferase [Tenuifilaceae bacterium]|nr:methionyl-tRNA formyltransferase [Tenuifilaceae bacterium]